jgi:hypothetical protein
MHHEGIALFVVKTIYRRKYGPDQLDGNECRDVKEYRNSLREKDKKRVYACRQELKGHKFVVAAITR